jgi:hypothetical protein
MMKGPTREFYPVGRQTVSVAIPSGKSFGAAKLLVAGTTASVKVTGNRVDIEVPEIELMEVVHLTWAN